MAGNALAVGGLDDAPLGDQGVDEARGGDVEAGVEGGAMLRGQRSISQAGDLLDGALLDGHGGVVGQVEVQGAGGGGHHEAYAMVAGQHGQAIGADLVGRISVGGDAVGADDDPVHLSPGHQLGGGAVDAEGEGDALSLQLPGGQPRPLPPGPGFADVDVGQSALAMGFANYPQGGAGAAGGQGAGIAMGVQPLARAQQSGPVAADGETMVGILAVQLPGQGQQALGHGAALLEDGPHAVERPEQVDRRGAGIGQLLEIGGQGGLPAFPRLAGGAGLAGCQGHAVGGSNVDGRRAPHHQVADGVRHLAGGVQRYIALLGGQQPLVQKLQPVGLPAYRIDVQGGSRRALTGSGARSIAISAGLVQTRRRAVSASGSVEAHLVVIGGGQGGHGQGQRDQQAQPEQQAAGQVDYEQDEAQAEKAEPLAADQAPAGLQGGPEIQPAVLDQGQGQHVADGQVDAGQNQQQEAQGDGDTGDEADQHQRDKVAEAFKQLFRSGFLVADVAAQPVVIAGQQGAGDHRLGQGADGAEALQDPGQHQQQQGIADVGSGAVPQQLPALFQVAGDHHGLQGGQLMGPDGAGAEVGLGLGGGNFLSGLGQFGVIVVRG